MTIHGIKTHHILQSGRKSRKNKHFNIQGYRSGHRIKEVDIIVYTSQLNLGSERSPLAGHMISNLGHSVQAERPKAARPNLT